MIYIMPYFKNQNINILFIHIPKTGGTSIENFLSKKYNIELNLNSLHKETSNFNPLLPGIYGKASLQHQKLETLHKFKGLLKINFQNLTIFTIVRNPYNRLVSDLFFFKLIKKDSKPNQVFEVIKKYLKSNKMDNHNIPQNEFILINNEIPDDVKVLKLENLNEDIKKQKLEFLNNFNIQKNKGKINQNKYLSYLNRDSINLINKFYHKDFELFNYDKL